MTYNRKTIGCSGVSMPEQCHSEVIRIAESLNIDLIEIPSGSEDPELFSRCDALFGDFTEDQIALAENITWF